MKPTTRFKQKWNSLSLPVQLLVIVASTLLPFLAFALGGWVFLALFVIFIASPFYTWFALDGKPHDVEYQFDDEHRTDDIYTDPSYSSVSGNIWNTHDD